MSIPQNLIEDVCLELIKTVNLTDNLTDITVKKIAKIIVRILNIKKRTSRGSLDCYIFKDHSWKQIIGLSVISNDICNNLQTMKLPYGEEDGTTRRTLLTRFKSMAFGLNVQREMIKAMNTVVEFDTNPLLMCCNNGVIDLEKGIFRDGLPEDYCNISTRLNYKEPSMEELNDLEMYLSKTFPNKEMLNQVIDTFTQCLVNYGHHNSYRQNRCIFDSENILGVKSTFRSLIKYVFGEYATSICEGLIEQANLNGRKLVIYHHSRRLLSLGHIKSGLSEIQSPIWFEQLPTDIHDSVRHGLFRYHSKLNILKFESTFIQQRNFRNMKYMSDTFNKRQSSKGLAFEAVDDYVMREKLGDLAPVMLWKLFQNHNAKIREKLSFHLESGWTLKKYDNCNHTPDIVTHSFDYVITQCGCSKCVEFFIETNWSKARLIYHLEDIVSDIQFTIADFFIRL